MKKFLILLLLSFNCYSEPINIFVTSTPGGGIDLFAREVGKILTESGYENVIINQGGAGGDIAYNSTMSKENNSILVGALQNFAFSHVINKRENFHIKKMKIIAPVVEPTPVVETAPVAVAPAKKPRAPKAAPVVAEKKPRAKKPATPAITAPTTAGGVQAVATATMLVGSGSTVGSGVGASVGTASTCTTPYSSRVTIRPSIKRTPVRVCPS